MGSRSVKDGAKKQLKLEFNRGYVDSVDFALSHLQLRVDMIQNQINNPSPIMWHSTDTAKNLLDALKQNYEKPQPTGMPPRAQALPSIAQERLHKTLTAIKYALRKMQGLAYLVSETSFTINISRSFLRRTVVVNAYSGPDFFVDCKYLDANGSPRSAGYSTLAEACADITAIVMFYAMR